MVKGRAGLVFGGLVAVSALLTVGLQYAYAWHDESALREVETFRGLPRHDVYARLRAMWITPVSWPDSDDRYLTSTEPMFVRSWPSSGDVEISFPHATRKGPEGICGSYARAVIHFTRERVVKVSEGVGLLACL